MEQIKKIVEVGCRGIVKDPPMIADLSTRGERDVYLVSDLDCPKYSFLMILSDKEKKRNNYKNLGCYSDVVKHLPMQKVCLDGIFSVKKYHSGGYESVYLWSNSASEATILYNLGLRIWKKIISGRGESLTVDSVLSRLQKSDGISSSRGENAYLIRPGMENLPYDRDVRMISLGTPETQDLEREEISYSIASKISEVHRDMYFRHDSAFDEMHKVASLFGLSLPASPEERENKSSSQR